MKLQYVNNWEHDQYFLGDRQISSLKEVEIQGVKYPVTTRSVTVPYSDMGHSYTATSDHYYIEGSEFGVKTQVDLNTLVNRINVKPTIYNLHSE